MRIEMKKVLFILMSLISILFIKKTSTDIENIKLNSPNVEDFVYCSNSEQIICDGTFTLNFISSKEILGIESVNEVIIVNYSINLKEASCSVIVDNNKIIGTIDFYIFLNDGATYSYKLYYGRTSGNLYTSCISLDTIKRKIGINCGYDFQKSLDTTNNSNKNVKKSSVIGIASGHVHGNFRWIDDSGVSHPLVGAKIQITLKNSWWNSTTFTNEDGEYSFDFSNIWHLFSTYEPKQHIFLESEYIAVKPVGNDTYHKEIMLPMDNGESYEYSETFSPIDDFGMSVCILQAGVYYSKYAKKVSQINNLAKCNINYPYVNNNGGSYYSDNEIFLNSGLTSNNMISSYMDWDAIGHEYGHHLQKLFDISDSPGGTHYLVRNAIDVIYDTFNESGERIYSLEQAKNMGIRQAWGEAWPTFWSTIAQLSFPEDVKSINTVADSEYQSNNGAYLDINAYSDEKYNGEACEGTIIRILYKLNSLETDEFDKFSIDENTLWDIIVSNHIKNFPDFIKKLYNLGYNQSDISKLLSQYNIGVKQIDCVSENYYDVNPIYQWNNDYGSIYFDYNKFYIYFYSKSLDVIFTTNVTTNSFIMGDDEWKCILENDGDVYYVIIVSKQVDYFDSGGYISQTFTFSKPVDYKYRICIKPNMWGFNQEYYFENNKWKQLSYPIEAKGLVIDNDRLRCGYIIDKYIVLSPRRKGAGEAYLTMTFSQVVYSYLINISLWGDNEKLNGNDSSINIEYMNLDGTWICDCDYLNEYKDNISKKPDYNKIIKTHPEGIYGLRIVAKSSAVGNDNKGRVCIGNIVLCNDPDNTKIIY